MIGARCTHSNVFSQGLLITRILLGNMTSTASYHLYESLRIDCEIVLILLCVVFKKFNRGVAQTGSALASSKRSMVRIHSPRPNNLKIDSQKQSDFRGDVTKYGKVLVPARIGLQVRVLSSLPKIILSFLFS